MTYVLIREILFDYGLGKLSIDIKADIDMYLQLLSEEDRNLMLYFAQGYGVTYLAAYIPDAEERIRSILKALAEYLGVYDTSLYRFTSDKKGLKDFLLFYDRTWDRLEIVRELWKNQYLLPQ